MSENKTTNLILKKILSGPSGPRCCALPINTLHTSLCHNAKHYCDVPHAPLVSFNIIRPPLPIMTRSKSPVSNSGEFFAMAKARRRQKRQAKKAAKREAERSNSGKSPCHFLIGFALTVETSFAALLGVLLTHQAQGIWPPNPLIRAAYNPSKRCSDMAMSLRVVPAWVSRNESMTRKCCEITQVKTQFQATAPSSSRPLITSCPAFADLARHEKQRPKLARTPAPSATVLRKSYLQMVPCPHARVILTTSEVVR